VSDDKKERARARRIDTARELEGRGHVDHAVREYLKAKAPSEAARLLASKGRLKDAGQAILDGLKVSDDALDGLAASDLELVKQAVVFFRQASEGGRADALERALSGAAPSDSSPRALGLPSAAGSSAPPSKPSPPRSSTPAAPKVAPPKVAPPSISFRPPAASSSPSFRPPAGSFRPPSGVTASVHPPKPAAVPRDVPLPPPKSPPPARPKTSAPPERRSAPAPAEAAPPPPRSPPAQSPPPRTPPPRTPPPETPHPERPKAPAGHALSASGEEVTEYSGSRAAGWRDAGDEDIDRSIQEHLEAGRKGAAARIARDVGRYEQALAWFRELDLHMPAGACLRAMGKPEEALAELLQEDPEGSSYRKACFELIPVATELNRLDFDIDRFLSRFVEEGPQDRDEIPTYLQLAELFVATRFPRGAERCLAKVLETDPDHADAKARLKALERGESEPPKRRPSGSAVTRGLPPLPTLEELRELARAHAPA